MIFQEWDGIISMSNNLKKMKKKLIFIVTIGIVLNSYGQIGIGTTDISDKAILHISGMSKGNYKGFMPPRVPDNDAKLEIGATEDDKGMIVYVRSTGSLEIWNGENWSNMHQNVTSGYAKDLFISEYVEKSSGNNKAIEIANFTGTPVNLSDYSLLVNSNGGVPANNSGSPGHGGISATEHSLGSQILNHGDVFVIKTSTANEIDSSFYSGPLAFFDGNDPIILKKSGAGQHWIDVIGVPRVNWEFGKALTLRRKPGFGPSEYYVPDQFEVYPEGTYDGLGTHNY